ncbi:MAG: BON domain-containing protein [Fimbriimonadales bacterium]
MALADVETRRMVLREISKRHIDSSRLDVQVFHGVVYLRGTVSGMRGHDIDIKAEMEVIRRILRQRPGIRDVVVDVIYR